jgi:hypothetical protein
MKSTKSTFTLRIFAPHPPLWGSLQYCNAWITDLLAFCEQAKVDRIQFFVNTRYGSYYLPATSAEEQAPWVDWMRESVVPRVREADIAFDLNFQMLLGATTWGNFDVRADYDWEFLVDQEGVENFVAADPCGPRFRDKMGRMLELWASLKPDILWVDDDFRMHNHTIRQTEMDFYSFSDAWLNDFSEHIGERVDCSRLVSALLQGGVPDPLRAKWQDFVSARMSETALWIRRRVNSVSPNTRLAQMVSDPDVHSLEGRDWRSFLGNLSGDQRPLVRPPCAIYTSTNRPIKDHACSFRYFARTMATLDATMGAGKIDYAPELENARFTTWAKPVAGSSFCIVLAFLLGSPEITMSLFDLEGSPLSEEPSNLTMLQSVKGQCDAICDLSISHSLPRGCVFLVDPDVGRKVQADAGATRLESLLPARRWEEILSTSGIPLRYATPADARNSQEVVFLDKKTAWLPSDEELRSMLAGRLFLDAEAARVLCERGFSADVRVEVVGRRKDYAVQSEIFNRSGFFTDEMRRVPHKGFDWYELKANGASVLSEFLDPRGNMLPGFCAVETPSGGRLIVSGTVGEMEPYAVFGNHTRMRFLREMLKWLYAGRALPVLAELPHHSLLIQRELHGAVLVAIANLGADVLRNITLLWEKTPPRNGQRLGIDGRWEEIKALESSAGRIMVHDANLDPLNWAVFRFNS